MEFSTVFLFLHYMYYVFDKRKCKIKKRLTFKYYCCAYEILNLLGDSGDLKSAIYVCTCSLKK